MVSCRSAGAGWSRLALLAQLAVSHGTSHSTAGWLGLSSGRGWPWEGDCGLSTGTVSSPLPPLPPPSSGQSESQARAGQTLRWGHGLQSLMDTLYRYMAQGVDTGRGSRAASTGIHLLQQDRRARALCAKLTTNTQHTGHSWGLGHGDGHDVAVAPGSGESTWI